MLIYELMFFLLRQSPAFSSLNEGTQLTERDEQNRWLWQVTLDQTPDFAREGFDHTQPDITIYGNTVAANQGKTEAEVVLGHGDNRLTFQTFAIPKASLN